MNESWEREQLQSLLHAGIKERRSARRWAIFFRLVTFSIVILVIAMMMGWVGKKAGDEMTGPHTAVVRLEGAIAAGGEANASMLIEGLTAAFEDKNTKAVILQANSPGGSPVQAGMMADEIARLKKLHPKIPFYVVIEEICASGCYYAAAGADKIYADKASMVGSIGVLMDGFGFSGVMEKLGVERRLLTAGANKGFLDPYSPMSQGQRDKAQVMLDEIHQQFIGVVKAGRGNKLADNPDLFSGLVWSGAASIKMGLVDALGSVDSVARDVVKAKDIVDFTPRPSYADRLARQIGVTAANKLVSEFNLQLK
ncbi:MULTISPECIES: S49 family peptidase [unclassified Iodobacter]|uniref:S49 family peptidase n=1 Tax=unclassified Iodobacter TaxID=235634 RepID=UPI0025DCAA04|nr:MULTISPECIES: S49 family peptidase [unclassified Iodobacter]MDW5417284.1 S49 family peptidase [Iodobacter sp. CM08]